MPWETRTSPEHLISRPPAPEVCRRRFAEVAAAAACDIGSSSPETTHEPPPMAELSAICRWVVGSHFRSSCMENFLRRHRHGKTCRCRHKSGLVFISCWCIYVERNLYHFLLSSSYSFYEVIWLCFLSVSGVKLVGRRRFGRRENMD